MDSSGKFLGMWFFELSAETLTSGMKNRHSCQNSIQHIQKKTFWVFFCQTFSLLSFFFAFIAEFFCTFVGSFGESDAFYVSSENFLGKFSPEKCFSLELSSKSEQNVSEYWEKISRIVKNSILPVQVKTLSKKYYFRNFSFFSSFRNFSKKCLNLDRKFW